MNWVDIIILILLGGVVLYILGRVLYKKFGIFKRFYHDICKVHIPGDMRNGYLVVYSRCRHCGKKMIRNERGRWV